MTATTLSDSYSLTVNNGSGDGMYPSGRSVTVSADPPGAGQTFAVWAGDAAILENFTSATTRAFIPLRDVTITATYSPIVQSITLAWNPSASADVTGYKIYYRTSSGSAQETLDVGKVTNATVPSLKEGTT